MADDIQVTDEEIAEFAPGPWAQRHAEGIDLPPAIRHRVRRAADKAKSDQSLDVTS